MQQELFRRALVWLVNVSELINQVLEVDLIDERVKLTIYDLPADRS